MTEKRTFTTIPAEPGWQVAYFCPEGEHGVFYFAPLIAWEIERFERPYLTRPKRPDELCVSHFCTPITPSGGAEDMANEWALRSPDGRFHEPMVTSWKTEGEALAEFVQRAKDVLKDALKEKTA